MVKASRARSQTPPTLPAPQVGSHGRGGGAARTSPQSPVLPRIRNPLLPPAGSAPRGPPRPPLTTPVFTIRVPSKIRVVLAEKQRTAACQRTGQGGTAETARQLLASLRQHPYVFVWGKGNSARLVLPFCVRLAKTRFICLWFLRPGNATLGALPEGRMPSLQPRLDQMPDLHRKQKQLMVTVFPALLIILLFIAIYLNYNQPLKIVLKAQVDSFSRLDLGYSQRLEQLLFLGDVEGNTTSAPSADACITPLWTPGYRNQRASVKMICS